MGPAAAARTMNCPRAATFGSGHWSYQVSREMDGAPGVTALMARKAGADGAHGNIVGRGRRPSVRARGIDAFPAAARFGAAHARVAAVPTGTARWASAIRSARRQPFGPRPGRLAPVAGAGAAGWVAYGPAKPARAKGRLEHGPALVVHGVVPAGARPIRRRVHTVRGYQGLWWGGGEELFGALRVRPSSGVAAAASRASGKARGFVIMSPVSCTPQTGGIVAGQGVFRDAVALVEGRRPPAAPGGPVRDGRLGLS